IGGRAGSCAGCRRCCPRSVTTSFMRPSPACWPLTKPTSAGSEPSSMHLTLHSDYALRLLMLLAMEPDELHTIEEIARRYRVSRNHLMKVAQALAQGGFIESLRGRGGGLRLARPAASINLGAVVRATEDGFTLVECFGEAENNCVVAPACGLRGPLE